jgi:UDP-glucose 4-epimerase
MHSQPAGAPGSETEPFDGPMMRVLVTGGAGFIGSHLCADLVQRGLRVAVLDDFSTGRPENLAGVPVDLLQGCVTDPDAVASAMNSVDGVVHLAAVSSVPLSFRHPRRTHDVNVTGTLNILEAARAVGAHVVIASSAAVYGDNPSPALSEDLRPEPRSPYAASKLAAEAYAMSWQQAFGLPTLAFRFFNVYGPRQFCGDGCAAVIPAFVTAALAGEPLQIFGDGRQSRDFIPVGTVAQVLCDAVIRRLTHPTPVNLALGRPTTLLELAGLIETAIGHPLERQYSPVRSGDIRESCGKGDLLHRLFPQLRPVSLMEGLRSTVDWWRGVALPIPSSRQPGGVTARPRDGVPVR